MVSGLLAAITRRGDPAVAGPSIVSASAVFGVDLVVSGCRADSTSTAFAELDGCKVLNFISGVASVILGILAFRYFGDGYAVLPLATWIGVGFISAVRRRCALLPTSSSWPRCVLSASSASPPAS